MSPKERSEQILPAGVRTTAALHPSALLWRRGLGGERGQAETRVHTGAFRVHWINCNDTKPSYILHHQAFFQVPFCQQISQRCHIVLSTTHAMVH